MNKNGVNMYNIQTTRESVPVPYANIAKNQFAYCNNNNNNNRTMTT